MLGFILYGILITWKRKFGVIKLRYVHYVHNVVIKKLLLIYKPLVVYLY